MPPTAQKKGRAPRPKKAEDVAAEADVPITAMHEFSIRGEVVGRLALRSIPLDEILEVRTQTRRAWQDVLGQAGVELDITCVAIFVWLARRASGEPRLSWEQFKATWDNTLLIQDVTFEILAPEDDPEGADDPQL